MSDKRRTGEKVTLPHDAMRSEQRSEESQGEGNIGWYIGGDYEYTKRFLSRQKMWIKKQFWSLKVYIMMRKFILMKKSGISPLWIHKLLCGAE